MKKVIFIIASLIPKLAFLLAVLLVLVCSPNLYAMAAEEPSEYKKTLPNGGQLLIKSKTDIETPFGHQWYHYEYSYVAPSGMTDKIGESSCKNSPVDANPDAIFAGKLILIALKCPMFYQAPALLVRTVKNGWRNYSFYKYEYDKYPLWLKRKVKLDDSYDGGSKIIAIDKDKLTVVVEYSTYKTSKMTFRLSGDGEKLEMINLERRIDPNQDPVRLIAQLTDKSQLPMTRAYAATFLGGIEEHNAVDALISALSDDGLHVRESAIEALGRIGDERAGPPLLAILENKKENKYIKSAVAKALGEIKDLRAVQPLIASLRDDAPELRCASAEALGEIGDRRALAPLIYISQQRFREKWWVRRCAVKGLGHFKSPQSIQALNDTLAAFIENKDVKNAARDSLNRIRKVLQ